MYGEHVKQTHLILAFSLCLLHKGHNLDPDDSEVLFHLALNHALMRQMTKALKNIRNALKMDMNQSFFSAYFTSYTFFPEKGKLPVYAPPCVEFVEAQEVCDTALMEFPDDLKCVLYFSSQLSRLLDASELLLLTKVKLEKACLGGEQALITCKRLLETWKQVYESDLSGLV
ncbi:hypothetical protein pdam_00016578 [Pocillopora damicornis]|uniref:KIF-binding protein n=1 Tax=Pocillopora damicornis TaxID=46731 RepID=A0A3M6TGV9_POCDA|nr:hypothetical protein pdam_00016578 [Pocillopora damicornis]